MQVREQTNIIEAASKKERGGGEGKGKGKEKGRLHQLLEGDVDHVLLMILTGDKELPG
jgi:hypothetical protein